MVLPDLPAAVFDRFCQMFRQRSFPAVEFYQIIDYFGGYSRVISQAISITLPSCQELKFELQFNLIYSIIYSG
jgi:hypothetical protein